MPESNEDFLEKMESFHQIWTELKGIAASKPQPVRRTEPSTVTEVIVRVGSPGDLRILSGGEVGGGSGSGGGSGPRTVSATCCTKPPCSTGIVISFPKDAGEESLIKDVASKMGISFETYVEQLRVEALSSLLDSATRARFESDRASIEGSSGAGTATDTSTPATGLAGTGTAAPTGTDSDTADSGGSPS